MIKVLVKQGFVHN